MTDISQGVQRANVTLEAMQEVAKDNLTELKNERVISPIFRKRVRRHRKSFCKTLVDNKKKNSDTHAPS